MSTCPYARVLFVGPDLQRGAYAELFQRQLLALRGQAALGDIVDSENSYQPLWQRVRQCIAAGELPLLLVDLDPNASSPYLDWLRSELQTISRESGHTDQLFVMPGNADALAATCARIAEPDRHLGCVEVPSLPDSHAWSCIPPHSQRLLLCNGPRCTRRGALPLWKSLREQLKAAGKLECEGGVHITRTQCQFPCDQGPTLSLYPAGTWYQIRDEADVRRLVQEQFVEGREVAELIMRRD